jgi:DNA-binding IclR family transcriptional regulator
VTDYSIAVLDDAIRVLEVLEHNPDGLTLAQITERSGYVKNKVFRILFTFEKNQLIERGERGEFRLGLRLLELGQGVKHQTSIVEAGRKTLDWLVKQTGESIFVGVVSGTEALCIDARQSTQSVRLFAEVGRRVPLHSGGVPKTLLAFVPEKERRALLAEFERDSGIPGVNVDVLKIEAALAQIRQQGYAVVADELDIGAHSVAAPIRNHLGCVVAAISIAGPSHRFPAERIDLYVRLVLEASAAISKALGYKQPVKQLAAD